MKKKHILLLVFAILLAVIISLSVWQQDNLRALIYAAVMNSEELAAKQKETENKLKNTLTESGLTVPDVSGSDVSGMLDGDKTSREIAEQMMKDKQGNSNGVALDKKSKDETNKGNDSDSLITPGVKGTPVPETTNAAENQTSDSDDNTKTNGSEERAVSDDLQYQIDLRVTQLYVIEAAYNKKIDAVVEAAKQEFYALPAEKRTASSRYDIVMNKVHELTDLEISCDWEVSAVVSEIEGLLKNADKSTDICKEILNYYQDKKTERRAYYLAYLKEH